MEWVTLYDLAEDVARVQQMQKVALDESTDMGLSVRPALVGSNDWRRRVDAGELPSQTLRGRISRVFWTGHGDYPEFEITEESGEKSSWTREGDISRYVEGLAVELRYVLHPWKVPGLHGLGDSSRLVVSIRIQSSDQRFDPSAPGPFRGVK